jgi:prepilin-type processing-associated H-X9-DG protein
LAADFNPGKQGNFDVTLPDPSSGASAMKMANSANHSGQGENVLFGDGHVDFALNPFCGTRRDNVYTVSGSTDGSVTTSTTIVGSPKWQGDSVLLPARSP